MDSVRRIGYNTDKAMLVTWLLLCDDLGTPECQPIRAALARGDIRLARELAGSLKTLGTSVSTFKRHAQIAAWCKRYRFANDLFTDEELGSMSWNKYSDTQVRLGTPFRVDRLYHSGLVRTWRRLAREALGEYTESEHFERCAFARNACVGHPASRKGLDQKLKGPITGSLEHIRFLQRYAETDPTLAYILTRCESSPAPSLRLTFVPKSYKALRAIMPDTLAGSFYSSGLGEMFKSRLKRLGLNIDTLQRRHRALARRASRMSWLRCGRTSAYRLSTIDLSSASDSITPQLLRLILPRKWYSAVMHGRVPYYQYREGTYRNMSACTMGLGHTFALETFVFYVLTKGIAEWYGPAAARSVSVYGDDIIATTETVCGKGKPSLISIFQAVHLQINPDKSYWGYCDFRESCGGDFYRGHAVRPSSPEGEASDLPKNTYVTFLYKLANSLLRNWSPPVVETTLAWIVSEIYMIDGIVLAVPPSFPDTSGLKVDPGEWMTDELETVNFGSKVVQHYQITKPGRRCSYELAYLWDSMRVKSLQQPRRWSLTDYEAPKGLKVVHRKVRFRAGYKTVSFLMVDNPRATGSYKVAKSVCPAWR